MPNTRNWVNAPAGRRCANCMSWLAIYPHSERRCQFDIYFRARDSISASVILAGSVEGGRSAGCTHVAQSKQISETAALIFAQHSPKRCSLDRWGGAANLSDIVLTSTTSAERSYFCPNLRLRRC